MQRKINHFFKEQKGFTLTELIVVLLIIAVLAAVAIPVYLNVTNNAKESADKANISIIESAVELYAANTGDYPVVSDGNGQAKFNELINILFSEKYIKESKIESAQTGKHFSYNSGTHTVSIE